MAINAEHASIVLKRVADRPDPSEQIVLISGKDKQRIPIHRVILNAVSTYFADLLGPKVGEGKPKDFVLVDADGGTIKTVVDFCYTGNIQLTEENAEKCLKIASSVEIDLLQDKCRQFYTTKLSVANAVSILIVADKYRCGDLRERAFHLICDSFEAVPPADILKLSYPLFLELLKSDDIRGAGDLCATRLLEWFQFGEDERGVHMPELLKLIRLEKLTSEFLTDTLEAVFKKFKCFDLLVAEYKRRLPSRSVEIDVLCSRSIFNVFLQISGENGASYSAVKVGKFNNRLSRFNEVVEIPLGERKYFRAVLHAQKVFVLGGFSNQSFLSSVSAYDLISRKEEVLPGMHVARGSFTTVVLGKYIYAIGGLCTSGAMDSCERFDTENHTWTTIKSMNFARYSFSATILNGYIYVAGGYAGNGHTIESTEIYDPKTDEWLTSTPMREARTVFALIESNGLVYAMGGVEEGIRIFDPFKNCWTEIASFDGSSLVTSSIKIDGELYAIMANGKFGKIEIDGSGKCSFTMLNNSNFASGYYPRHFLYHN